MAYCAIFDIQVHAGDEIPIAQLNGILELFSAALKRGVQRRVCNPPFQSEQLRLTQLGATDVRIALENLNLLESESKLEPFPQLINRLKNPLKITIIRGFIVLHGFLRKFIYILSLC
jgi:hypothetical protein